MVSWPAWKGGSPSRVNMGRRKWATSVTVATVDLRPHRLVRCSMATVGGTPVMRSTSGRSSWFTYCRTYVDRLSR